MKSIHSVTFILLIVGGLNWLLAAFGYGIQGWLPLPGPVFTLIYILVGLSAIYEIATHKQNCKLCGTPGVGI